MYLRLTHNKDYLLIIVDTKWRHVTEEAPAGRPLSWLSCRLLTSTTSDRDSTRPPTTSACPRTDPSALWWARYERGTPTGPPRSAESPTPFDRFDWWNLCTKCNLKLEWHWQELIPQPRSLMSHICHPLSLRHRHSAPSGAAWRHIFSLFPLPNSTARHRFLFCNVDCAVFLKFYLINDILIIFV